MTADEYLRDILRREAVDTSPSSPYQSIVSDFKAIIKSWAGSCFYDLTPSGSFAKGTANKSKSDIDLLISLTPETTNSLKEIYDSLFNHLSGYSLSPRRQNVSIGVQYKGIGIDVIPGKLRDRRSDDHSLYVRKKDTWRQTNVAQHIRIVGGSRRVEEIRVIKLWRDQWGIEWDSIYLELMVIDALSGRGYGDLANNVFTVFEYIRDRIGAYRVIDPANSNNIISDDLSAAEKKAISDAAATAHRASYWKEIVR